MAEEKKKKPRGRRAYLEDFHPTVSGEYIYTGQTYDFQGGPEAQRKSLTRLGVLSVLIVAAAIAACCISAPGSTSCLYVLLPCAAAMITALTLAWGALKLMQSAVPLRQYVYKATVKQFPPRTALTAIFSALALVGECLYAALYGLGGLGSGMALYLLCEALVLAGTLLFRHLTRTMVWIPRIREL